MDILNALTSFEARLAAYVLSLLATSIGSFYAVWSIKRPVSWAHKRVLFFIALALWIVSGLASWHIAHTLTKIPMVHRTVPKAGIILSATKPDISVAFTTPVNFNHLQVHVFPDVEMSVVTRKFFGTPFGTRLTITPKVTFTPGETVIIYFSNIEGVSTLGYGGEQRLEYTAAELPSIKSIDPPYDAVEVSTTAEFVATLTSPASLISEWSARIDPAHPITLKQSDDGLKLTISPDEPYPQSKSFTLTITRTGITTKYENKEVVSRESPHIEKAISFVTLRSPDIKSFEPQGKSVDPKGDITIVFDNPMDTASVQSNMRIEPDVSKEFSWEENNTSLRISHKELPKDSNVTVTFPQGVKTASGGTMEKDAIFQFKTAGPMTIKDTNPPNGARDVAVAGPIRITFDQDVEASVLAQYITISPDISLKPNISGSLLELIPETSLSTDTKYTIRIAPGMKGKYGLPSTGDQSFTFTTTANQIALAVPYYNQQTLFTCNVAAARMLLAFRGVYVDENKLLEAIGTQNGRGSGNPHKGYVPNYGTYWDPVSQGVSKFRPTRLISGGKLSDIIAELKKGNPVMVWGQNGWSDPHDISWTASDGTFIKATNGMHSSVVRGFRGPEDNPTQLILNDPWRGQYAINRDEFMRRWNYFKMAMVVE